MNVLASLLENLMELVDYYMQLERLMMILMRFDLIILPIYRYHFIILTID